MTFRLLYTSLLTLSVVLFSTSSFAAQRHKPFYLADIHGSNMAKVANEVKSRLTKEGFDVIGNYRPSRKTQVIVFTNDSLKKMVKRNRNAAYLAGFRVAITNTSPAIQVSYTNPLYFGYAYRIKEDLSGLDGKLVKALGRKRTFGSRRGLTKQKLFRYHYAFGMEYFDDHLNIRKFSNHQDAIKTIEQGFKEGRGETKKVYRIDIPGKDITIYGVSILAGAGADTVLMNLIDHYKLKHTAHFPYEMVVYKGVVEALHPRLRIALAYPDTRMAGPGSFMSIMTAPDAIYASLVRLAGGIPIESEDDNWASEDDY